MKTSQISYNTPPAPIVENVNDWNDKIILSTINWIVKYFDQIHCFFIAENVHQIDSVHRPLWMVEVDKVYEQNIFGQSSFSNPVNVAYKTLSSNLYTQLFTLGICLGVLLWIPAFSYYSL